MRTLVHLSDLHFGRLEAATLKALISSVVASKPDLVIVSGDLTQRARQREFEEARRLLDALPSPQIVVPGNHDVPLYNVLARARTPFAKFRRNITEDLEPFYADDEIAVLGINTARAFTFKNGRINQRQIVRSCARLHACPSSLTRIVVTHHPFDSPQAPVRTGLVGRAAMAMAAFARCGVDLILSGHLHISHTSQSAVRYKIAGYSALMIQAGTATSTRGRGELNSFNIIRIEGPAVSVDCLAWNRARASFAVSGTDRFRRAPEGWSRSSPENTVSRR